MVMLAIAYPVVVHWAVVTRSVALTIASLALLSALALLPRLVSRSVLAWCLLPMVIAGLWLLGNLNVSWLPLYAAPVFINLFGSWIFAHTLAPEKCRSSSDWLASFTRPTTSAKTSRATLAR